MDIMQGLQAKAVVTLSKDMTLRDYAQGCWRMRQLARGQTLHLYVVEEIMQLITDTVPNAGEEDRFLPAEVVAFLAVNSCRSEAMCAMQTKVRGWNGRSFCLSLLLLLLLPPLPPPPPPRMAHISGLPPPFAILASLSSRTLTRCAVGAPCRRCSPTPRLRRCASRPWRLLCSS